MADREMIAATLAAALLIGQNHSGPHSDPGGYAVMVYQQVLNALDRAASAPLAQRPNPPSTP
jgi:hypothetical protein